MRAKPTSLLVASLLAPFLFAACRRVAAEPPIAERDRVVRLAELEIDPAQLERYKAALRAEIEASLRLEPGVLALYAVAVKDHAAQVRLFEMYASAAAYQAHLQTPHFRRYKTETASMVRSLRLLETAPIMLGAK